MIINEVDTIPTFKCKHTLMLYLLYDCAIPLLRYDEKYYYFAKTKALEEALKHMGIGLKILTLFTK